MPERTAIKRGLWHAVVLALPIVFILVPMLSFVLYSFWSLQDGQLVQKFTLANYRTFFTDESFLTIYGNTILLSFEVTALNLVIGYLIALFLARRTPRVRFGLMMLFMIPLFMSYIIKIYAVRGILGQRGVLNEILLAAGVIDQPLTALLFSRPAIFLTQVIVYLPFAVLPIFLAMERIPTNYVAASADLGGTVWHELRWIVLPLSLPGVVLATVFTFVLTFGDFVTPQMVGGTEGFTFGRIVFSQFGLTLNWPLGAALAVILLGTSLLLVALAGAAMRRRLI
jgi:spermidine/putrescine transport system permease protein